LTSAGNRIILEGYLRRVIMHILLTNDDGVFAPGLAAIHKRLVRLGKVTVVAPTEAKSGASHSWIRQVDLVVTVLTGHLLTALSWQLWNLPASRSTLLFPE